MRRRNVVGKDPGVEIGKKQNKARSTWHCLTQIVKKEEVWR